MSGLTTRDSARREEVPDTVLLSGLPHDVTIRDIIDCVSLVAEVKVSTFLFFIRRKRDFQQ
jgi:hypothetical protein